MTKYGFGDKSSPHNTSTTSDANMVTMPKRKQQPEPSHMCRS